MGGGPVDLFVDLGELGRLRGELQTLVAELEQLGDQPAGDTSPEAMGHDWLAREVEGFGTAWRDALTRIRDGLAGCMLLTEIAVESYTTTENVLQNAAEAS